jgi:signal transduction histidine kinase
MAHALADGRTDYRVHLNRSDELGELADAFNFGADEIARQQQAVIEANGQLENKVQQRTAELEKLNARLKAEMAEKEDFLRAVSHDLNAPLRNISGMASMLMMKYQATLEKDAVQRLERIQKNVEIECELINEILELSRIKTRREKIEQVDLQQLMHQVAEQFENDLETRGITLRVNSPLPVMMVERSRMRQVFQNLVDNAIKYMRPDGPRTIDIEVSAAGNELIISVRDTGMGIAADDLPFMFHVFRRAKNAQNARIPGKGVGLASVKSIFEIYIGRLWVESKQGEGTTFFIALPAHHFARATAEATT